MKHQLDILDYLRMWRDEKKGKYLILVLILIFALLTAFVLIMPTSFIDIEFSEEVQENIRPFLDSVMKLVSWFGRTWIAVAMAAVAALAFLTAGYKKDALFMLSTLLISPVNAVIKILINRPRPTEELVYIVQEARHNSFPSGHVSLYVVFFGFLIFLMLRHQNFPKFIRYMVIIFSLLLILSVPFSRVYLGVHWLTDVTAGFVLGLIFLIALIMLYLKFSRSSPGTQ